MRHLLVFLLCLGTLSCLNEREYSQEDIQALIEGEVEQRLQRHRQVKRQRCQEEIIERANQIVDSLLIIEARRERDAADKPPKPERPPRPTIKSLLDTQEIKPLFFATDSTQSDTLLPDSLRQR